ncbi:MAG TPA: DinB family protein [Terriglobales bacterium]|nr:DinB family protein [Terriglobales bacterium]
MFSKTGLIELHATMHERLDLLLRHVATVPGELHHQAIPGFGHPSVWKQLVHILTCEEGWVHDLQSKNFDGWSEEDCLKMPALLTHRDRIREATRTYLGSLTEDQLNTTLATRPADWGGELRSPAFILLHVITHAFHHKGQIVAMLRILGYPAPDTDLQPV